MNNTTIQSGYMQKPFVGTAQNTNLKPEAPFAGNDTDKKEKIKKAVIVASCAAAAAGIAAIAIIRHKNLKSAKAAAQNLVQNAAAGNNNVLSKALQEEDKAVQKFINENPKGWEKIKNQISSMIDIKNADDVIQDGTIYHGTSAKSAKNILENGPTPFSARRVGSGSGMGYGIYTSPNLEAAQYYSENGVVLPYKIEGKVATLKEGIKDTNSIKAEVVCGISKIIDPPTQTILAVPSDEAERLSNGVITKAMQELGVDGIYTNSAITRGFMTNVFGKAPEFLDKAGQLAVFNGNSLKFKPEQFSSDSLKKLANAIMKK